MQKKIIPLTLLLALAQLKSQAACNNSVVCTGSGSLEASLNLQGRSDAQVQFESALILDVTREGNDLEVRKEKSENLFFVNPNGYYQAINLGGFSVGQKAYEGRYANSFNDVLGKLRAESPALSTQQKLMVLKEAASRLSAQYDYSLKNTDSSQEVFDNARINGKKGGICGDIHHYLAEMAQALGFEQVGTHTLQWAKTSDKGTGHFVYHFRDPKTGEFYIQNYNTIIATNATDLPTAIDVSTRIQGPLTNLSMVEGRPGVFHAYTPETARWIYGQVDRLLGDRSERSKIIIDANDDGQYLGLKISSSSPIGQVSGFILTKQEKTTQGKYQVSVIGVELLNRAETTIFDKVDIGVESMLRTGALNLKAPTYFPETGFENYDMTSGFIDSQIIGYAKVDKTTGEIEFSGKSVDMRLQDGSAPLLHFKMRMMQDVGYRNRILVERSYVNTRSNYDYQNQKFTVEADRIGIVIDARETGAEKAYLKFQGDYYFLEGVTANSAHAIRAQLTGVIPEPILNGELHVVLDVSKIIRNPKDDALYRYFNESTASSLMIAWEKKLNQSVTVGVSAEVAKNRPYPLFQETQTSLNSDKQVNDRRFMAYVRIVF